jgi:hypothetical protein
MATPTPMGMSPSLTYGAAELTDLTSFMRSAVNATRRGGFVGAERQENIGMSLSLAFAVACLDVKGHML